MDTGKLNQICAGFRFRLKAMLIQAGLSRLVTVGVVLLGLLLLADWWARLGTPVRLAMLLVYLAGLAATVWWTLLVPLRQPWSVTQILAYMDSVLPPGQNMLLDLQELTESAHQIEELASPVGGQMAQAAASGLSGLADSVDAGQALRATKALRWLSGAAVAATALILFGVLAPAHLAAGCTRLFNPFSQKRWPHRTTVVLSKDVPSAVGLFAPLTIEADVIGRQPPSGYAELYWKAEGTRKFKREQVPIEDGRIRHLFPSVNQPLTYYIVAGDYETDTYKVAVSNRPYITNVAVKYHHPPYMGIPDADGDSLTINAPEGTTVDIAFESSMRLKGAHLVELPRRDRHDRRPAGTQPVPTLEMVSPTQFRISGLKLQYDRLFAVKLDEEYGATQARDERMELVVGRDELPTVDLRRPTGDPPFQTNRAVIEVDFLAKDDYGLKHVEFLYSLDRQPAAPLTRNIAGDIPQTGTQCEWRFDWPLRNMEQVPESGLLTCFVRVRDGVSDDRPAVESQKVTLNLLKPTDFHLEVLRLSREMLAQARLAWLNQLQAYRDCQKWQAEGTEEKYDAIWQQMLSGQSNSFHHAKNMWDQLAWLTDQYTRNKMESDFMSGRLVPIGGLARDLIDKEHEAVSQALRTLRVTSADGPQLRQIRLDAARNFVNNQKMAVLTLERILEKLYDWRDLQLATVTTTQMIEQQEDVTRLTEALPTEWVGKQKEDLKPDEQDRLLTLGKQQRVVFDTETALESQLDDLMHKAKKMGRKSIREPLWTAWQVLRSNRVNDHLKRAADMIDDNQPSQIVNNQKTAVRILRIVEAGLFKAGSQVDPDEPLKLAMDVRKEEEFDPERPVAPPPPQVAVKPPDGADPTDPGRLIDDDDPFRPPADPTTALAAAIRATRELQDNVQARLRYLAQNSDAAKEMPRFILLKLLMLAERQQTASSVGLDRAIDSAAKAGSPAVRELLAGLRVELDQFRKLVAEKNLSQTHRHAQGDCVQSLDDLIQLLGWETSTEEAANENKSQGGVDSFGRSFVLQGEAVDTVATMVGQTNHALLLQRDVGRKIKRFKQSPATSGLIVDIEKVNRTRAAAAQQKTADLVNQVISLGGSISQEAGQKVQEAGTAALAELKLVDFVKPVAGGSLTDEQFEQMQLAEKRLIATMHNLRDLLNERVKPPPPPPVAVKPPTPEEIDRLKSADYLAEGIRNNPHIPQPVKDRMLRAVETRLDAYPGYGEFVRAYYRSFRVEGAEPSATQPDGGEETPPGPEPAPTPGP